MSRRQRKINRLVQDILTGEMKVSGFDFNESDLRVGRKQISASGDFLNLGTVDMVVKFNKKVHIKSVSAAIDYSVNDRFLSQSWQFSKYKKFEKAIIGSHEDTYLRASNLAGKGLDNFDKAVDLYESIPGVKNLTIQMYEPGYGSQTWS